MSNPTTPFSWQMPTATDLVTDLPADFEVFGQAVATSMADLLGGTSGQILAKNSNTDMDFVWIANDQGDITGITAGTGISVTSPTGPVPTVAIDTAVTVDKTTAQTLTNKTLTAPIINLAFNAQTGTTYTLVAGDSGKLVTTSNASPVTVTVPPSVFAAGEQINVQSIGVGLTSFAQGAGVTITSTGATATAPILRARYSAATIICTASNTFTIIGDLS
tara:strand:+ start:3348 stop:4004 length:657 start_codon:yes stop_codon:yes gene_type:complete